MRTLPHTFVLAMIGICVAVTGCKSFSAGNVLTTSRVKAVAALGAYVGAKKAVADGYAAEVQRAIAGLRALEQADVPDLPSVFAALDAAKLNWLSSNEGQFVATSAALFFTDVWTQTGQVALGHEYVKAFLSGVIDGASQALRADRATVKAVPESDKIALRFEAEAKATR